MLVLLLRRLAKRLLALCPRAIRHHFFRASLALDIDPPGALVVKLAETREELEAAFRLLHDMHVAAGGAPHPSGMRYTMHHSLPTTSTIIALWQGNVVGTISIFRDNPFGFPHSEAHAASFRGGDSRLAEIAALAVHPDFRGKKREIHFCLLKYVYEYCTRFFGVDHLFLAAPAKVADYYQGILFLEKLAPDFYHANVRTLYHRLANVYGTRTPHRDLAGFFCKRKLDNLAFPERRYFKVCDPIMTPEMLDYFFNVRSDIFRAMTDREKGLVRSLYDNAKYQHVLPPDPGIPLPRKEKRFDVNCPGCITFPGRIVGITIRNVSANGFCAFLKEPVSKKGSFSVNVAIGDYAMAVLEATPRWSDESGVYGFLVTKTCDNWRLFIQHLTSDLDRDKDEDERKAA